MIPIVNSLEVTSCFHYKYEYVSRNYVHVGTWMIQVHGLDEKSRCQQKPLCLGGNWMRAIQERDSERELAI